MLQIGNLEYLEGIESYENLCFFFPITINYNQVMWANIVVLISLHGLAMAGWVLFLLGYMHWQTVLCNFLFGYASIVGTTGAYCHWGHRNNETKQPLKLFFMIAQTLAPQGSIWAWVRDHRQQCEYKNTDTDSSDSGRVLLQKKHPDDIIGKQFDVSDLEMDSFVMFQKRHYAAMYLSLALLQLAAPCYLWEEIVEISFLAFIARILSVLHITGAFTAYMTLVE